MADRIFLNPPEAIRQMIEDLRIIADVPMDPIERLSNWLKEREGFLTDSSLVDVVSEYFPEDTQGTAVFNALQNLEADKLNQVLETIQLWRKASERNSEQFSEVLQLALQQRLQRLVQDYPSLTRMRKAKRLRIVLGNELQGVGFVSDARPVFNDTKDRIEGLISLTTMKLVYERQNMEQEEVEIILTAQQLDHLISEAEKARQKLKVMKSSIVEWIPEGYVEDDE